MPKLKNLASFIRLDNFFKSKLGRNTNWKERFAFKKWRVILNPKTVSSLKRMGVSLPFQSEEVVLLTENRFGGSSRLIKLTIHSETKFKTRNGKISLLEHNNIIGKEHGDVLTLKDIPFRLQRPCLEDYVLYMKRIATPSYPKDIQAMLSMAGINPGCIVLEAGTGSGALTLYLSRAVGKEGQVHSFDNNQKHLIKAKENVTTWINSWNKSSYVLWPENVTFYHMSVRVCREALPLMAWIDTILLDLQSPENYLEFLIPTLKKESSIVMFLPSITQVVDVVSHCSKKKLPFHVDKVVEVSHRLWKIQPVNPVNRDDIQETEQKSEDVSETLSESFSTDDIMEMKYAAKPSFQQLPHTGFILRLIYRT